MRGSLALGRINPGEHDWIGGPTRAWRGDGPNTAVIYCHGSGGSALATSTDYDFGLNVDLARDHVDIFGDWADESWGNDLGGDRVHEAFLRSRDFGCVGPAVLVGVSMGNLTTMNYARRYPQNALAIAGIIPAISMADLIAVAPGTQAALDAAYPPGFTDADQGMTHSPIHMAENGLLPNIPIKLWCIASDTLTRLAPAQAFVAERPKTELELITEPWAYHGSIAVAAAQAEVAAWIRGVTS